MNRHGIVSTPAGAALTAPEFDPHYLEGQSELMRACFAEIYRLKALRAENPEQRRAIGKAIREQTDRAGLLLTEIGKAINAQMLRDLMALDPADHTVN